jgi:hypothetical protein
MRGKVLYVRLTEVGSLLSCPVRAYVSIFGVALGMQMIGLQDGPKPES